MGTWGERAFENDTANDWAYDLDQDVACEALACEVLARLLGKPGYKDAFTEDVDKWVAKHKIRPPAALLKRASAAIDRILGEDSESRQMWEQSDDGDRNWRAAVEDLRRRLRK